MQGNEKLGAIASGTNFNSSSIAGGRSSMVGGKADPYALDFNSLRKEYIQNSNKKLPFCKSSFIHYAECPLDLEIDDEILKN